MAVNSLRIAVGSARRPKVEAVRSAMILLAPHLGVTTEQVEYVTVDVPSGVDETPRSLEDLMAGARNRARTLRDRMTAQADEAHYYIGLEGGLWCTKGTVFLQSWAFVTDGQRDAFGSSGAIMLPEVIADPVFHHRESLGTVIDRVASQENVRSNQGTWGILTKDLLTRQHSFTQALLSAFAPFYNREFYLSQRHSSSS
jgi:inosine/xanthosine triphosphatase